MVQKPQLTIHTNSDGSTRSYTYNYKRFTLVFNYKQSKLIEEAYNEYLKGTGCMVQTAWLKQIILDKLDIK